MDHGKAAGAGKGEGFGEFLLRLAGEADDQVRRDGAAGEPLLQQADALQIARRVIVAVHAAQHAVAAALQAQVELRAEILARGKAAAEVLVHHARLERAEAHAQLRHGPADGFDQIGKRAAVLEIAAPRCDLDAREHDLAVALERARLLHGLRQRKRAHRPAGVGDDAVGAEVAAAVLNLEHGAGARAEAPGRKRLKGAAAHGVVQQDLLPGVLPGLFLPHGVQHELDKGLASAAAGHDVHAESFDLPGADLCIAAAHADDGLRVLAAQAADEGAVLAVGDRRHGAGIDEIGIAVVGIRAADVAKGQKLLLHGLRFILIDLAAKRITLKFHRVSPKNL